MILNNKKKIENNLNSAIDVYPSQAKRKMALLLGASYGGNEFIVAKLSLIHSSYGACSVTRHPHLDGTLYRNVWMILSELLAFGCHKSTETIVAAG